MMVGEINMKEEKGYLLKKKIYLQSLIIGILFLLSIFLPYTAYFHPDGEISHYEFGFQSFDAILLTFCFVNMLFACFSFYKIIVLIINIFILLLLLVIFIMNSLLSNMYANHGPVTPETQLGFILSFLLVLIYLLKTFIWRNQFDSIQIKQIQSIIFTVAAIVLPITAFIILYNLIYGEGI